MRLFFRVTACGMVLSGLACIAQASSISLDLKRQDIENFVGGEMIGPLATDSANWNGIAGATGNLTALVDDTGTATTASVVWSSRNTWSAGPTDNDQERLARGYLDDGTDAAGVEGVLITFSDIPFDRYRVYGLLQSDQDATEYTTQDFDVNGIFVFGGGSAATAPAYPTLAASLAGSGSDWSLANGTDRGNYWTTVASGPTLTIDGLLRDNTIRGSISGVIIQEIPEPTSVVLLGMGLLGGLGLIRRKR